MKKPLLFLMTLMSLPAVGAIFGVDDRVSIMPGSLGHNLSRSTAVAVLSSNIEPGLNGKFRLLTDKLELLCPSVRFANHPSLAYSCSGFLVAPDLIVTAGHCMVNTGESRHETETYCKAYSWLFDYNETSNVAEIEEKNHYRCKEVIFAIKDEQAPFRDFALVRLERPVTGRLPLKLSTSPLMPNETLSMIGHPMGTPAKLSRNAKILLNNPSRESFITTLDANAGNSGSAVFNSKNEVVGILVGGTPSLDTVTIGRCEKLNTCSEKATQCFLPDNDTSIFPGFQIVGTEVQRIGAVKKLMLNY